MDLANAVLIGVNQTLGEMMRAALIFILSLMAVAAFAETGAGYACVGGFLYKPDGNSSYVGSSECQSAKIKGTFACVGGYLYTPDSKSTYVGSSSCQTSQLGGGYACIDGFLHKPNGSSSYVGSSECQSANFGD